MQQWIMVVDDNKINRLYFQKVLQKLGYQVRTANSGVEAIAICKESCLEKNIASLILMDIRMQEMNGIEATKEIRKLCDYQDIPILAISAEQPEHVGINLFQEILLKPVSKESLERSINHHISLSALDNLPSNICIKQGLKATNNNKDILKRLQSMLAKSLIQEFNQIQQYDLSNDTIKLNDCLHQLLGSVKLCGAVEIESVIMQLKDALNTKSDRSETIARLKSAFNHFIEVVDETDEFRVR